MVKKRSEDWLLGKPLPVRRVMFGNVRAKIGDYKTSFSLADDWIKSVELICDTFTAAYDGVMENRATGKQMDSWFENLTDAPTENVPAADSPDFLKITLPAGALQGLYKSFRKKMDFFKSNEAYTRADGKNLMIVAPEGEERNVEDAFPELKPSVDVDNEISAAYTRGDFGGAEVQWRVAGATMWQLGDKSSETVIRFKPEGITLPAKIELRGVYLLKNQRVGKWSPNYTLTIG